MNNKFKKTILKKYIICILLLMSLIICGCNQEPVLPHEHTLGVWKYHDDVLCKEEYVADKICETCNEILEEQILTKNHDLYEVKSSNECAERYQVYTRCNNCTYETVKTVKGPGHIYGDYIITREPTKSLCGLKQRSCTNCEYVEEPIEFTDNTFSYHGKLSVKGADLIDSYKNKFQLIGLSTHGLQWFGHYVNYDTFKAIKDEFGINVIRLALYTSENGYCTGTDLRKQNMYNAVVNGIKIATSLDMYVIVDWHMVGAESVDDKNPLTYVNEAKEFFGEISKKFADNENILYEIMNEPNGATTWQNCKDYANQVIPAIRENTDAIVLVGNPKWTADLNSVVKDPLVGYTNIMYTYHFYAADHKSTNQVTNAYSMGIPVFISEHGGMYSDGNRTIDYASIKNWYKILDDRNISYVAWNISNSNGTASILKSSNHDLSNFSDSGLKVWGRWYKIWTRTKAKLTVYGSVDEATEK